MAWEQRDRPKRTISQKPDYVRETPEAMLLKKKTER